MANPADEAAIEAAKANEQASLTYAEGITRTAQENYAAFKETAEQTLAQRYIVYAKSGNTSTEVGELPPSGVSTNAVDSEEYKKQKSELEGKVDTLTAEIADAQKKLDKIPEYERRGPDYDAMMAGLEEKKTELANAQKGLEGLGPGNAALGQIQSNPMTGHLSGSDLLTEVTFRDLAQRHGYTQLRTAQNQAAAAVEQAENFDIQANYLEDAKNYNTWTTVLGAGLTIAGLTISLLGLPMVGLPMAAAGAATGGGGS